MFKSSQPIQIISDSRLGRHGSQLWVCKWQSPSPSPEQGGVFLVEAHHVIVAKLTAKKTLRDDVALSRKFTFTIRLPSFLERAHLKIMPPTVVGKQFAQIICADSKNKTD